MALSMGILAADDPGAEVRPIIARSWLRSTACGVVQASDLRLPYDEDIDDDSRLIRTAQPVLERLMATMSDTRYSLLLADLPSIAGHLGLFGFEPAYVEQVDRNLAELLATPI